MEEGLKSGSPPRPLVPPEVPGFTMGRLLGAGGTGEVFLARQLSLDRDVAIKVLRRELISEEWLLERLEREARTLARLRHPHLVTVHDFVRLSDGGAAVVMEWVEGGNLRSHLNASPTGLPITDVWRWGRQVAAGLAAAHETGIVHRDVKPENVLLDAREQVRVSDFGMALPLEPGATRLTGTGIVTGTPGYLAPEQLAGGPVDVRVDVFGFAVMIYEMLTGRIPAGHFDPPSARRPEIPRELEAMILRSLRPDPADRPAGLGPWLELLDSESGGAGVAKKVEPGPEVESAVRLPPRRPRRQFLWAGVVGVAVWGGCMAWRQTRRTRDPEPAGSGAGAVEDSGTVSEGTGGWRRVAWPADLAAAAVSGHWTRDGEFVVSDESIAILGLADDWPEEFALRCRFRRRTGSASVAVFFRLPGGTGSCELDAWNRHLGGVQALDDRTLADGNGFELTVAPGELRVLSLTVSRGSIEVRVDGVLRRNYPIEGKRLSVVWPWKWPGEGRTPALAIGSYQGSIRFEGIEWRPLDPAR